MKLKATSGFAFVGILLITGLLNQTVYSTGNTAVVRKPKAVSSRLRPSSTQSVRLATRQSVTRADVPKARYYVRRDGNQAVMPDGNRYPVKTYQALGMPNDPAASQAWVTSAALGGAWDVPYGDRPTTLAIIDTGFALNHEELAGRWYRNSAELPNGIDDDNNGYVDDFQGWDFTNADNSVQTSLAGHATAVAGVAAASGNNGVGIAGVDWGTKILPLQALGDNGQGYNTDVANAIYYAADKGADVISLSLGTPDSDPVVRQAVHYAVAAGSVVVAAAGNDGCDCISYPANYPEVIAVGAADYAGKLATFSSYGANLDVLAPGINLYTSDWKPDTPTTGYAYYSGTSLATPVISGLLTRLKSQQPGATPLQLTAAMLENTNRSGLAETVARDNKSGFGFVNAQRASQRMQTSYVPFQVYALTPVSQGNLLNPASPAEKTGTASAIQCENQQPGATPIYELTKKSQPFYSISTAESRQAVSQGYTSNILSYACLMQPQDRPQSIRAINIYKEFKNLDPAVFKP